MFSFLAFTHDDDHDDGYDIAADLVGFSVRAWPRGIGPPPWGSGVEAVEECLHGFLWRGMSATRPLRFCGPIWGCPTVLASGHRTMGHRPHAWRLRLPVVGPMGTTRPESVRRVAGWNLPVGRQEIPLAAGSVVITSIARGRQVYGSLSVRGRPPIFNM